MRLKISKEKIFFVLLLCVLFISLYHFQAQIKNSIYFLTSPIETSIFNLSKKIFYFFEPIFKSSSLKKENEILKSEIKKLIAENESLRELQKENEALKKALGLQLEKKFDLEMAKFIGKDISGDFLRINLGSKEGMKEGLVVIGPENYLIGKIFKVYPNFSVVQVFTDKNFTFDVKIPEKEIVGLARGEGNFKAKIELLPKEKEIAPGDKLFTASLSGKFPEGIFVGEIEKIENSGNEFYQTARLKPAFELENLDHLFVILNF